MWSSLPCFFTSCHSATSCHIINVPYYSFHNLTTTFTSSLKLQKGIHSWYMQELIQQSTVDPSHQPMTTKCSMLRYNTKNNWCNPAPSLCMLVSWLCTESAVGCYQLWCYVSSCALHFVTWTLHHNKDSHDRACRSKTLFPCTLATEFVGAWPYYASIMCFIKQR